MALFRRKKEPQNIERKFQTGEEVIYAGHTPEEMIGLSRLIASISPEQWQVEVIPEEKPVLTYDHADPEFNHKRWTTTETKFGGAVMSTVTQEGFEIKLVSSITGKEEKTYDIYGVRNRLESESENRERNFSVDVNDNRVYSITGSDFPGDAAITYGETGFGQAPCWDTFLKLDEHFFGEQRREMERQEREGQETQDAAQRERQETEAGFWGGLRGG